MKIARTSSASASSREQQQCFGRQMQRVLRLLVGIVFVIHVTRLRARLGQQQQDVSSDQELSSFSEKLTLEYVTTESSSAAITSSVEEQINNNNNTKSSTNSIGSSTMREDPLMEEKSSDEKEKVTQHNVTTIRSAAVNKEETNNKKKHQSSNSNNNNTEAPTPSGSTRDEEGNKKTTSSKRTIAKHHHDDSTDDTDDNNKDEAPSKKKKKPLNVIVLYPDDMRHDSLGCAGTQIVQTPFLDRLAKEGIRFTHNSVTTSICWISRATLFSGQYLSRHGAEFLFRFIGPAAWNYSYPGLLREKAGYYTGHVGKWQFRNGGKLKGQFFDYVKLIEGKHVYTHKKKTHYVTDKNENDAIDFLRTRPKDRPFSLQVAFYAPKAVGNSDMQWTPMNKTAHLYNNTTLRYPADMNHSWHRLPKFFRDNKDNGKFAARSRWKERFGNETKFDASMKAYYRMITEMDEASKHIYEELERQGILNETMVIFTSDNGFFHSEHGLSGKWFPYKESIRVPLIIRDPRMPADKVGTTNDEFTLNIDLASTILGAAGLETHPLMQGRDIADLYLPRGNDVNHQPWRKEFYYEFPGKGKRIIPTSNALIRKDFKYFHWPEYKQEQLFDLRKDPDEEYNLINSTEYANVVTEMKKRYRELQKEVK